MTPNWLDIDPTLNNRPLGDRETADSLNNKQLPRGDGEAALNQQTAASHAIIINVIINIIINVISIIVIIIVIIVILVIIIIVNYYFCQLLFGQRVDDSSKV